MFTGKIFAFSQFILIALTHTALEENALLVKNLNVKDGGHQPILRDTIFNGKIQTFVTADGKPKGLKSILQERDLFKRNMSKKEMIDELSKCQDFKEEKPCLQKLIESRGHIFLLLPKYHCELNPIERCWAFSKPKICQKSVGTISWLKARIRESLADINLTLIQKTFRKIREYEHAYREGAPNSEIDKFAKRYKSH